MMIAGVTLLGLGVLLSIGVAVFVNTSPQFGQPPQGKDLQKIQTSLHYGDDKFLNLNPTTTGSVWKALKKLPEMMSSKGKVPKAPVPADFAEIVNTESKQGTWVTWFGHSAFLLEIQDQRILLDPMLGEVASPISWGSERFDYESEIPLETISDIDVVLYSHDHYDHLDYHSVQLLKDKVQLFITPLGVGSHLRSWGVAPEKIIELDWWDTHDHGPLKFTACPARHFSGRGVTDRDATQWAGWAIRSEQFNIFFSGDSGYDEHFKEIGKKLGPFDFAMIECGQYNEAWNQIHMMPEESVQAGIDLKAGLAMPIHWGAFRLAPHSWTDPVTRFRNKALETGLPFITPEIGDRWELGREHPNHTWWSDVE